ncbi:MAG TPA: hypothetical protein VN030_06090 [Cellvibrio sp.]|nr:hypothetical protein [Cellvibrio sp.]
MKFSFVFYCATLLSASALAAESQPEKWQGHWAVDCNTSTSLKFGANKTAVLTVNQNQIYIEIKYREITDGTAEFFYVQPEELGSGGNAIDWDNISTSASIGTFRGQAERKASFSWLGFSDKKTAKHFWVKEADFATAKNEVALVRCD